MSGAWATATPGNKNPLLAPTGALLGRPYGHRTTHPTKQMTYEFDYQVLESLTDTYGLSLEVEEGYPADVKGMRALDYEPDMDDYEYQQSRY